jgi:hypothetical protein
LPLSLVVHADNRRITPVNTSARPMPVWQIETFTCYEVIKEKRQLEMKIQTAFFTDLKKY